MTGIPRFKIGNLEMQGIVGAMGVGNTGPDFINSLYDASKNEGVLEFFGTLSAVGGGVWKNYFKQSLIDNRDELNGLFGGEKKDFISELYVEADNRSLREDLRAIKCPKALNLMFATQNYKELANTAISEGINLMVIGAGAALRFPKEIDIPSESEILLGAIVNGGRTSETYCRNWGRFGHPPDLLVGEGPKAGGHIAYTLEQLADKDFVENGLEIIFREIVQATKNYRTIRGERIPIVLGGGIFDGYDIRRVLSWEEDGIKPSGVQMATRFLGTSDASEEHKQACIIAEERKIISSPVRMSGSAIRNKFIQEVEAGKKYPTGCAYHCLRSCKPDEVDYCIAKALVNVRNGNVDGVMFVGDSVKYCTQDNFMENGEFRKTESVLRDLDREYRDDVGVVK